MDLSRLHGKPVNQALAEAESLLKAGRGSLAEAKAVFALLAAQPGMPPRLLGKVRQRLWEVEKALGAHPLYLSQAGQDRFVHERFFRGRRGGTFVEVGGHDGYSGSNCYFFEKVLGWSGVVVEASPELAARVGEVRSCKVVQAAVGGYDGEGEFINVTSGLTQMGGMADGYPPENLKILGDSPATAFARVRVPVMRLEALLRGCGLARVDYCSIDVEGGEGAVLGTFDFAGFDVRVFSVETSGPDSAAAAALRAAGYEFAGVVGADEVYARP